MPEQFEQEMFYVVTKREAAEGMREINAPWLCGYLCPCGCGNKVQLPITLGAGVGWNLTIRDLMPTLSPSVSHTDGCKTHYFIKNGKVEMV